MVVETIEKVSVSKQESKGPSMPKFNSDAAKVTSKGMGLKKAFVGRQNQFTVDAGKAGEPGGVFCRLCVLQLVM